MIILDTDAVSELMRSRPSSRLVARLAEIPIDEQATTAITVGELAYGAYKAGRPELYQRAAGLLKGVYVLDFDHRAAEQYGRVRADLERAGRRLADPDLRIAAIAIVHRATVMSGNQRHFSRVPGLAAEDWLHEPG